MMKECAVQFITNPSLRRSKCMQFHYVSMRCTIPFYVENNE